MELQTLITPMLTQTIGSISVSTAADVGIASDANAAGGNNFAGAEVVLVRDFEAVLAQVDQVFEEVDRQPLQVSIEAMILSVKLSDETKIGVDWELLRNKQHIRIGFGAPLETTVGDMNLANNSGLKVGFLDSSLAAFLDALETIGETHVISSPRLMCLNKQRAEIHIGEEQGYVSTTVTETSATQSVEFLETGTQLRLRPYISNDGLVRLEIHPELSTGTVEVSENFTLPNKAVTQVTTNVMVRDGATLVIGGLIREDLESNSNQIPLLGSLPYVGPLFRHTTDKTSRDELIVLITPRIVWEPKFHCEGEYANCEFHMQHTVMADKMSHVSRVYYGRRYKRLAKAAWVAGDAKAALRYANMSIQFNRLDRDAIQLRTQIVANSPYGDKTIDWHLKEGLVPWTHPFAGKRLNNWVLDELHGPHTVLGQEPAPYYPQGPSGPSAEIVLPEIVVPPEIIEAPAAELVPDALPPAGVGDPQELVVPEEA
jgi:type IV pilus assembly protein PilQ